MHCYARLRALALSHTRTLAHRSKYSMTLEWNGHDLCRIVVYSMTLVSSREMVVYSKTLVSSHQMVLYFKILVSSRQGLHRTLVLGPQKFLRSSSFGRFVKMWGEEDPPYCMHTPGPMYAAYLYTYTYTSLYL